MERREAAPYPGNRSCSGVQDGAGLAVDQTQPDEAAHGLREALWDRTAPQSHVSADPEPFTNCFPSSSLHLEPQGSSDQRVRALDSVRLGVLGAVAVRKSLQVEGGKEIHGFCGVHQRAAGGDTHHLENKDLSRCDWTDNLNAKILRGFRTWLSLRKTAGLMVLRRTPYGLQLNL